MKGPSPLSTPLLAPHLLQPKEKHRQTEREMAKQMVVLFPAMGMGHLIPFVELAKLFARHHILVSVVLVHSPFTTTNSTADSFVSAVSSAHPLISFHRLPKPTPLPSPPPSSAFSLAFHHLRLSNPLLSELLTSLSQTTTIRALILDMFCTPALDVASELRLPAYIFFSSAASGLAMFLFFPKLQREMDADFKDLGDAPVRIPGLPPIPASDMPDGMKDRHDESTRILVVHFERIPTADGIIVNTFEMLEPRAVRALTDGLCVPDGIMPPIYCVGPLIADGDEKKGEEKKHECLRWLDGQPKGSVVFLCFGSMGSFNADQLKAIAIGLERSEQRFLWVVRSPPSDDDPAKRFEPRPEPDLNALMPEGFLGRTAGRGMVVKSWAPQAAVLAHESVGGFVSHCGWNSILEAVSAGVPLIAWPLYAEQKMNKVFLVEEARLAVEMKGYGEGVVAAEEVETKVRWLMESEGGRELRGRAAAMKESAEAAWRDGGSSDKAWTELVTLLLG